MNVFAVLLAGSVLASGVSIAEAQTSGAGTAAGSAAGVAGCTIAKTLPSLGALPSGTRVFFLPVLRVEHVRSAPEPRVVQVRELAGARDANAEVRDGVVYVRQDRQTLTALDRGAVKFDSALEVCVFPPGTPLSGSFATLNPDLITR